MPPDVLQSRLVGFLSSFPRVPESRRPNRWRIMRPIIPTLALAAVLAAAPALDAQTTLQALPSGRGRTEVTLQPPRDQAAAAQPATISLDWGQPHLRGRTLHTGDLVPYDQAWRTGANNATMLTTGVDLTIGGVAVPRGTYVVFTLP